MKVLNLQCSHQHSFEGWFASEDDFQSQLSRGMIECPLCADKSIQKLPSAPRLNFGSRARTELPPAEAVAPIRPADSTPGVASAGNELVTSGNPAEQALFLKALRHVMANTENVGERFADEARRMHYGEAEQRSIRGQASPLETVELMEEGIEVMPLPMLPGLKETLQ